MFEILTGIIEVSVGLLIACVLGTTIYKVGKFGLCQLGGSKQNSSICQPSSPTIVIGEKDNIIPIKRPLNTN